jgi:DNA-binding response OmpR family regulator
VRSNPLILVVDDEPDICGLVTYSLMRNAYRVRAASDGVEALEALEAEAPDLVVLDLMLPGMTGLDILRELRRRPGLTALPVVMLSARRDEGDRMTARRLGAADYITKPFSPAELVRRVDAVLGRLATAPAERGTAADPLHTRPDAASAAPAAPGEPDAGVVTLPR